MYNLINDLIHKIVPIATITHLDGQLSAAKGVAPGGVVRMADKYDSRAVLA